ncbi:phosphatidylinositol-glycan biosynthesis class X protein-like [Perognathus longimembris pacificus]|uniref:phosphatidylinositol-glycan biosynthesis class X protein-like n=1 Tax=Perognathus longimembris pacificus TaxID=214514 RepID=UPI0020184812|nr:phosphatidylinositol-glycan biosynthesis class X protein-like [Perognathus longimembris pacificus]
MLAPHPQGQAERKGMAEEMEVERMHLSQEAREMKLHIHRKRTDWVEIYENDISDDLQVVKPQVMYSFICMFSNSLVNVNYLQKLRSYGGGVAAVEHTVGPARGQELASSGAWRLWKLLAEKIRGADGPRTGVRSPHAPLGRPRSSVLAAPFVAIREVAWLLLWLAGLAHTLASAFSKVPFFDGIRATCSEIVLRQEVLKDGFHRDLVIKVKFGESIEDLQTCRLLIKHYIPTGLFVDPYELASLREKNVTEAVVVSEHFNIEAPNYLSRESEILMYARKDVQCIDCFHSFLPVHYHYHRPHSKDGDTLIVINNPDLLMYCDQEFLVLKCWAQSKVAAPCAFKSKDICQWNSMKYKSILKNVTLHVPVGLTIQTSLVCSVTLLTTILCSILILLAVFKYGHFFI